MNNREKYIKDNINNNEFARNLASYISGEEAYSLKSLDISNKITAFLKEEDGFEERREREKEIVEKSVDGVIEKLKEIDDIVDAITKDGRWWFNHTLVVGEDGYTFNIYANKRKIKKEEH